MAVELPESEFAADVIATDAFLDLAPGFKYKRENPSSLPAALLSYPCTEQSARGFDSDITCTTYI